MLYYSKVRYQVKLDTRIQILSSIRKISYDNNSQGYYHWDVAVQNAKWDLK